MTDGSTDGIEDTGPAESALRRQLAERTAEVDGLRAEVALSRHAGDVTAEFEAAVAATPEIVACYATTGKADYLIKVVTSDIKAYDEVLQQRIFRLPGVASVHTSVVLREVKDEVSLPL